MVIVFFGEEKMIFIYSRAPKLVFIVLTLILSSCGQQEGGSGSSQVSSMQSSEAIEDFKYLFKISLQQFSQGTKIYMIKNETFYLTKSPIYPKEVWGIQCQSRISVSLTILESKNGILKTLSEQVNLEDDEREECKKYSPKSVDTKNITIQPKSKRNRSCKCTNHFYEENQWHKRK